MTAGKPPRAKFVNYPLGFEAGRYQDKNDQLAVVREAMNGFEDFSKPTIDILPFEWPQGWDMVNEREKGKLDHRSPRTLEPQYQSDEDRMKAETS